MRRAAWLLIVAALGALNAQEAAPPQWPPAPQAARLRFVSEIRQARREEKRAGRLGSWARALLGVEAEAERAAAAETLVQPTGVWARGGVLWVADPGKPGVFRYETATGRGAWLKAPEGLESPVAVAAAADGRLYVLDSRLAKVFIVSAEGKALGELHGDPQGLGQPAGLAVSERRVYVSDVRQHRVSVYGLEGVFVQSFGRRGSGPGEFNFPTYLHFDARERQLWVSDSGNFRLQWFDPDGRPLGRFGETGNRPGYLARPRGVARDSEGHVYLSDGAFDAVQVFDPQGRLLLFAGLSGAGPGQFDLPAGLAFDEGDRLYVADTRNARVQVFQYVKEAAK